MSLKDFTIRFEPFIKQLEYYLQKNAPDILEKYEIERDFVKLEWQDYYVSFQHKELSKNLALCNYDYDKLGFAIRDIDGNPILDLKAASYSLLDYNADNDFSNKGDWKSKIDEKIEHLRKLDIDLTKAFDVAKEYYNLLHTEKWEYYFALNFYRGEIQYVQLVPGLLQKFFDYEKKINNVDDETFKKYEEMCLKRFHDKTVENQKADAFSPITTIPTYKTWLEDELSHVEQRKIDPTLREANEKCKDILDKINK